MIEGRKTVYREEFFEKYWWALEALRNGDKVKYTVAYSRSVVNNEKYIDYVEKTGTLMGIVYSSTHPFIIEEENDETCMFKRIKPTKRYTKERGII